METLVWWWLRCAAQTRGAACQLSPQLLPTVQQYASARELLVSTLVSLCTRDLLVKKPLLRLLGHPKPRHPFPHPAPAAWPACSVDGGMRQLLVAAAARAGAAAAGQAPPGGGYLERTAQRRWDMLRMLVDFQKAHRWGVVWVGGLRMRRDGSYSHMAAKAD